MPVRSTSVIATLIASLALAAPAGAQDAASVEGAPPTQPQIEARFKPLLRTDGLLFKDLNANASLDPYEDWRLAPAVRAQDLLARMTRDEKAGMLLIASHNPACDGSVSPMGRALIEEQHMTRFILRAKVTPEGPDCSVELSGFAARGGYPQTPAAMARFTNAVQELREASRLGIPALFKDNPRNHVETNPMFGIGIDSGSLSEFPKPAGLAAVALGAASPPTADGAVPADLEGDMRPIREFASVVAQEWRALGLRGMYGYMADLGTEPRWSRFHETFSEDADLVSDIMVTLVEELQGPVQANGLALGSDTAIAMTLKHFPGGGPQFLGLDAHYTFGKEQAYLDETGRYGFAYHLRPFIAAIEAGVSSIMPYYGVPMGVEYDGMRLEEVGMAFSGQIVTDLLRGRLGFQGNVNSDSGIIQERGWGFEDFRTNPATGAGYTIADRTAQALRSGTDVFSEFREKEPILALVDAGLLDIARDIDPAVARLLTEQFALGLFEDPYVEAAFVDRLIGTPANRALGEDFQRRSVVLLQNRDIDGAAVLPLAAGASVYTLGFAAGDLAALGYRAIDGNHQAGASRQPVPPGTDFALIKVMVENTGARAYRSNEPAFGGRAIDAGITIINGATGERQAAWGEQDPCVYRRDTEGEGEGEAPECVDSNLIFGGAFPWESGALSLSAIAEAQSWTMTPSLEEVKEVMAEIGDPRRVVVSIYFRQPYVLDEASGVLEAGGLLATLGVSDEAQLAVIAGTAEPSGRLPFALPKSVAAVTEQHPDAPGYAETADGALFPYGFGLGYRQAPATGE